MDIKERLLKLPVEILEEQGVIINNRKELFEVEKQIKKISNAIFEKVLNEVDGNGKAMYSNNEKRQIELSKRVEDNAELQELYEKQDLIEKRLEEIRFHLNYLNDLQSNLRAICRLGGDE